MTDEQLRAMARRVLGLALWCEPGGHLYYDNGRVKRIEELDAAAVAILREEMAKAQAANYAMAEELFPFVPHTDDPTQSFVATTDSMQQSIARTIEGDYLAKQFAD